MIERFRKASIRIQFTVIASFLSATAVCLAAALPEPFIFQGEKSLMVKGGQIEMALRQLRSAKNDSEIDTLIRLSASSGLELHIVPWTDVFEKSGRRPAELRSALPDEAEAFVLEDMPSMGGHHIRLAVQLDEGRAAIVGFSGNDVAPPFLSRVLEFVAKATILMLPMLLLAIYVTRTITSPLVRFVYAAKRLRLEDGEDELFIAEGARELRTLAASLNAMKRRIRKMLDDRTRMLTAVSHDLRTPLTRLRMRAERSEDAALREAMLADIDRLTVMIEECLQYLSSNTPTEPVRKVDISSLLYTIAAEFSDVGYAVTYHGPDRHKFVCRPNALTRAVTNVVENAVRFGTVIQVQLVVSPLGSAIIMVSDDGPGLSKDLHEKVLEPFFKADGARTSSTGSGFGLGLSIAEAIVKSHEGSLILENATPHGLRVKMMLPALSDSSQQSAMYPNKGKEVLSRITPTQPHEVTTKTV